MINLLVFLIPCFKTRHYVYRPSLAGRHPGKLILIRCKSMKFVLPGDRVHQVSWFNFFGIPLFIKLTVTQH